jgi:hypothetical protein
MVVSLFSLIKFNYLNLIFAHFDSSSFASITTFNDGCQSRFTVSILYTRE